MRAHSTHQGRIKYIGLSECTSAELRRAHAVHPVTAVQMEWSLAERGIERSGLVAACRELDVGMVVYSPLARGLLAGALAGAGDVASPCDRRANLPRFAAGNFEANVARASRLRELAARLRATPAQLALAWLLLQGDFVFPIPGSKTADRVEENFAAIELAERLTEADVAVIGALSFEQEGTRYAAAGTPHTWEARERAAL